MDGHHVAQTTTVVSGPLCRDAADCRLLGGVLCGEALGAAEVEGLRIGIVPGELWDDCDPEVSGACREALEDLRRETGGTVAEVEFAGREHAMMASILVGSTEELAEMTPERVESLGEEVSLIARALLRYRMLLPAVAVAKASRVRTMVRRSLAALFEDVDVLAWPTVPAPAPALENPTVELPSGAYPADYANPRHCGIANLTGIPGVSVPVGHSSAGLPIGLQLLAGWGRDELLLDCAEALERANDRRWVDSRPPLARPE
jgi:aspartyl-tRNA(Asn)/glutamyl-tRNA(Gln) amidotransferase subunit A